MAVRHTDTTSPVIAVAFLDLAPLKAGVNGSKVSSSGVGTARKLDRLYELLSGELPKPHGVRVESFPELGDRFLELLRIVALDGTRCELFDPVFEATSGQEDDPRR